MGTEWAELHVGLRNAEPGTGGVVIAGGRVTDAWKSLRFQTPISQHYMGNVAPFKVVPVPSPIHPRVAIVVQCYEHGVRRRFTFDKTHARSRERTHA